MTQEIHPQLAKIITDNIGNKITESLATGMLAMLQPVLQEVSQQAYAAGRKDAEQEAAAELAAQAEGGAA